MVAKPYINSNAANRAGIPLARAQRLSKRAEEESGRGAPAVVSLTLVSAVAVSVAGYLYGQPGEADVPEIAEIALSAPAVQAPVATPIELPMAFVDAVSVETDAPVELELAAIETFITPVEDVIPALTEEPITPNVVSYSPPNDLAPCVARIENRLNALHGVAIASSDWDTKRDSLRGVAQATLDCDLARMQFDGDIELAASGFASLRVEWDRDDATLDLRIVDSIAQEAEAVAYSDDGLPVEFLID